MFVCFLNIRNFEKQNSNCPHTLKSKKYSQLKNIYWFKNVIIVQKYVIKFKILVINLKNALRFRKLINYKTISVFFKTKIATHVQEFEEFLGLQKISII